MLEALALSLVLIGALMFLPALKATHQLALGLPAGFARSSWSTLGLLLALFLQGYLFFAWLSRGRIRSWEDLVVPIIFFFGAGFCWLVTRVSLHTTNELRQAVEAEVRLAQERDLAQSENRAKSTFLATMSHEIRTPLNAVIGLTGLLLESPLDIEQRNYAETVKSSGQALLGLLNDVLDFSRLEADRIELEEIDFNLRLTLEESLEMMSFKAQEKGLELTLLFHPEVPEPVRGDPGRIRQIVLNLLANAIKFSDQGEIVLEVTCLSQIDLVRLRLSVRDQGVGIDTPTQERLFEPFRQAQAATASIYGGSGLGLAICKKLAQAMGGQIGVNSELGQGADFWVELRVAAGQKPEPLMQNPLPTGLRVLLLDSRPESSQVVMLKQQLQRLGCHCVCQSQPRADQSADFQVALLEKQEWASQLREQPAWQKVPMVMLTAQPQRGQAEKCRQLGLVGYLSRPIRSQVLCEMLQTVTAGETPAALVTRHTLEEHKAGARRRVLVADDNSVNQKVASRILEKAGYLCDVVGNGQEALKAIQTLPYDVILMDCQMPILDGYQATRQIRQLPAPIGQVPIVAVSAGVTLEERRLCQDSGMNGFVAKPLQPDLLLQAISQLLEP